MDFIGNQAPQIEEMLKTLGIDSVDDLLRDIPERLLLQRPLVDDGISEYEGLKEMETLAKKNHFLEYDCYLGAGAYDHYIPAVVGSITQKAQFLTSYTPYQAEASQGYLQAIFEFQTLMSRLTGLDVTNASVYDGGSACAEAVLMALRIQKGRNRILISGSLNPRYRAVVDLYCTESGATLETISSEVDPQFDENIAAILLPYPNYFGQIELYEELVQEAKKCGALVVLQANPLIFGLFKSAGELGADIACGDAQSLGVPLSFGGPYVGYLSCKQEYIRHIPGRLVGETKNAKGERAFCLTLQTREQHIRRGKATSNICTNQALAALAVLVTLLWYGKEGLPKLTLTNYRRANYLKEQLKALGYEVMKGETFNEFVFKLKRPMEEVFSKAREAKIIPGIDLGKEFPKFKDHLLAAVTEKKSLEQLDAYVALMRLLL